MKNNKRRFVIIASMLVLVIALVAMSVSTFAKYTTEKDIETGSVTVAKWGFVLSAEGELKNDYVLYTDNGEGAYVAGNTDKLRPGSNGEFTFSVRGSAEVKASVTVAIAIDDISLTDAEDNVYNPIDWTLSKKNGDSYDVVASGVSAINAYFSGSETVDAGKEYTKAGDYKLTYEWDFDNSAKSTALGITGDAADTILGSETIPTGYTADKSMAVSISIDATQIAD